MDANRAEKMLVRICAEATIKTSRILFKDHRTETIRMWREYYDCPSLEGFEMKKHIADGLWLFIPTLWSVEGCEDWYSMNEYTHKNVKLIDFITRHGGKIVEAN